MPDNKPLFSVFKTFCIVHHNKEDKDCFETCLGHGDLYEAQECMKYCQPEHNRLLFEAKQLGKNMEFRICRVDHYECEGEENICKN